jgi:hypothetical protein
MEPVDEVSFVPAEFMLRLGSKSGGLAGRQVSSLMGSWKLVQTLFSFLSNAPFISNSIESVDADNDIINSCPSISAGASDGDPKDFDCVMEDMSTCPPSSSCVKRSPNAGSCIR